MTRKPEFTPCEDCAHEGRHVRATCVATFWTWRNTGEARPVCDRHATLNADLWREMEKGRVGCLKSHNYYREPYNGPDGIGFKGDPSLIAKSLTGSRIAEAKKALLKLLAESGPMAAEPASRACNLDPDFGSPRLSTMKVDGLLYVADRDGVSDRNQPCGRYALTDLGRAVLAITQQGEAA